MVKGVSIVIGALLMVVITITLAASVFIFLAGVVETEGQGNFEVDSASCDTFSGNYYVIIRNADPVNDLETKDFEVIVDSVPSEVSRWVTPDIGDISWLEGYNYRVPVTVNGIDSSIEGYQLAIITDFVDGKMDISGGDITVTDSDGFTEIDFWIESIESQPDGVKIWTKVPTIEQDLASDPSLVAFWKFDSDSSIITDETGNGYDGNVVGTPLLKEGKFDGALEFGHGAHVDNVNVPMGDDWTITAWFPVPSIGFEKDNRWATLVRGDPNDHHVLVRYNFDSDGKRLLGTFDNDNSPHWNKCDPEFDINSLSEGWHHIAAVQNGGVSGDINFYMDGNWVCGVSGHGSTETIRSVGGFWNGGGQYWGTLDQVKIFNRALSSKEVSEDFVKKQDKTLYVYYNGPLTSKSSYEDTFDLVGEADSIIVGESEQNVDFQNTYAKVPRIFATPVTDSVRFESGNEPSLPYLQQRQVIRNLTQAGHRFKIEQVEADSYKDGVNPSQIDYIALIPGRYYIGTSLFTWVGDTWVIGGGYKKIKHNGYTDPVFFAESRKVFWLPDHSERSTFHSDTYARANESTKTYTLLQIEDAVTSAANGVDTTLSDKELVSFAVVEKNSEGIEKFETGIKEGASSGLVKQTFSNSYDDPVVVSFLASEMGTNSCYAIQGNIKSNSVDVACEESAKWDGSHTAENISWMVTEAGNIYGRKYVATEPSVSIGLEETEDNFEGSVIKSSSGSGTAVIPGVTEGTHRIKVIGPNRFTREVTISCAG